MIVGCLKEIKDNENRVALTPPGVKEFVVRNHTVLVEKGAGTGSGFPDSEYRDAGADMIESPEEICRRAELILKIKEPLEGERGMFRKNQMIFGYFHFASDRKLTEDMMGTGSSCIAYETINNTGKMVLLAPMSEVAGKMAVLMGSYYLMKFKGGMGLLPTGVTGIEPAHIVIVGGGFAGRSAAKVSVGLGAKTTILEKNPDSIDSLKREFPEADIIESTHDSLSQSVRDADVLVGAVHIPGLRAPKIIKKEMIESMKKGSVFVDVAIDQGGISETSRPTSHSDPVYDYGGVIHYCVTNMPGAFPKTSTLALTRATLPYALKLAEKGLSALKENKGFADGLNIHNGLVSNESVAKSLELDYTPVEELISGF